MVTQRPSTPAFYGRLREQPAGLLILVSTLLLAVAYWAGSVLMPQVLDRPGPQAAVIALLTAGLAGFVLLSIHERLDGRREIGRRLDDLQAQYGAAESLAVLGSWVFDLAQGRYYWSEGTHRLFGSDPSRPAPSARTFLEQIHPEDRKRWQDAHRRAIRTGEEARVEYRYQRPHADQVWVRSVALPETGRSGRVRRLAGIVQDITAMSAMAQQLAASEAKFRDLTQLSADWVWESDTSHRMSYLSDSIVTALGGEWARSGLGKRAWEFASLATRPVDWESLKSRLDAHEPFERFEFGVCDPQGNLHQVSLNGRPILDNQGQFQGYRGVGRTITREHQQQQLLQFESEMANIMREHTDPQRVLTDLIASLCASMGWSGGAHLVQIPGTRSLTVRERWGTSPVLQMLDALPPQLVISNESIEGRTWSSGQPLWLPSLAQEYEFAMRYQTGSLGLQAAFIAPILDENHRVLSALLFFSPISYRADTLMGQLAETLSSTISLYLQRKTAEQRLLHASLHDALTGLPNRVYLTHQLDELIKAGQASAVLYVDLDRYKLINDTLGHSVGDQVLIEVARRLRESIRPTDVAGRIGGDEFILLLVGLREPDQIEPIARKVLEAIERPFVLLNRAHFLSASIGVAITPGDGQDAQTLIKAADSAMYRAKSAGRNTVEYFAGEAAQARDEALQLGVDFPLALQRGEIDLHYQPVMAVGERRIVGMEGLMRWRHPTRGMLLPDQFLPMAEGNNLVREIGLWAIRRAIDDRIEIGLDRFQDVPVSVNLSPRQLAEEGFLTQINGLLAERRFPPRLLRLELTENALIDNSSKTVALLAELRRLGIQVIIDNFGTGYASLSYLKNLPVDGLKIDHTFIRGLPHDRGNAAIVQAVTTLAGKLGLQAMAEGVETAEEMKALRELRCERMQGTFISEPMPLAQLKDFLESLPKVRQMHLVRAEGASGSV